MKSFQKRKLATSWSFFDQRNTFVNTSKEGDSGDMVDWEIPYDSVVIEALCEILL